MIIVTIKNNAERANNHRHQKKTAHSALIIIVTIKNNTERANHYRNNQKQHTARSSSL